MRRIPVAAALLALSSGALTIALWSLDLRWAGLFVLFWFSALGLALLRSLEVPIERLLLCTFVLAQSIRMDVHLVHVPGSYGFPVGLSDLWWLSLLVLWYFRVRREGTVVEWPRRFAIPLALIVLGAVIAALRHPEWSTRFRMGTYVVQSALLFFYLWNLRLVERDYRRLAVGIGAALLIQGVIGSLQGATRSTLGLEFFGASSAGVNTESFTSFSRVGGTLGQPNRFAMFMNSVLFVPLAMAFAARTLRGRLAYLLTFAVAFAAVILSQSRGAWLGFGIALVPFAWFALRERLSRLHSALAVSWVLAGSLAVAVALPPVYERLTQPDNSAAYSRIPMALTALDMIRDNPFGVGFGQYVARMNEYDVTQDGLTYRFRFAVHNAYLLLAAEQGIWVLLAYLAILVQYYAGVVRLAAERPGFPRVLGLALGAGMLAIHLHKSVEISYLMINVHEWFVTGMTLQVLRHLQSRSAESGLAGAPPRAAPLASGAAA
jgi:O-antigen ligase